MSFSLCHLKTRASQALSLTFLGDLPSKIQPLCCRLPRKQRFSLSGNGSLFLHLSWLLFSCWCGEHGKLGKQGSCKICWQHNVCRTRIFGTIFGQREMKKICRDSRRCQPNEPTSSLLSLSFNRLSRAS